MSRPDSRHEKHIDTPFGSKKIVKKKEQDKLFNDQHPAISQRVQQF